LKDFEFESWFYGDDNFTAVKKGDPSDLITMLKREYAKYNMIIKD
jgi:hypothetical protein